MRLKRKERTPVKKLYALLSILLLCTSCQFKWPSWGDESDASHNKVQRYDRLESRYLTTGDYSALQQMNTDFPIETRTLIEKVLQVGQVNDPDISHRFLMFYQDSVLQSLIAEAETEYANMDDINQSFDEAFARLQAWVPNIERPEIYTQIGALDQSIIIGDESIGISLDKYLGENYPLYKKYYPANQRVTMTRAYIVPDAMLFFLLGQYSMSHYEQRSQLERDLHMGKMMWVVNKLVGRQAYQTDYTRMVDRYMARNKHYGVKALLESDDYSSMK